MGKSVRFILLAIEGIITIILTVTLVHGISSAIEQGSWHIARTHLLPSLIHLWVTMVVATLLCFFYRANIGAEARMLPTLFLMISLGNVKIFPLYHSVTTILVLSPYAIAVLYHFSLLYSSFLFLGSAIFQQTINPTRLSQYSLAGAILALFITILTPISINQPSFLYEVSVTNALFSSICIIMNVLAALTFLVSMLDEQFSRHALGRSLAFILMITGNAMVTMSQRPLFNTLGLIIYLAGSITLLSVTRTYHVWV